MSPAALALAVGLHALVAAGLWWASPLRRLDHFETPIMISMEPAPLSVGNAETPVAASPASSPSPSRPEAPPAAATAPAEPAPPEVPAPPPQQTAVAPAKPEPAQPRERAPEVAPPSAPTPTPAVPAPSMPAAASEMPAPPTPLPVPAPTATETPLPPPTETATAMTAPATPSEAEAEAAWQTDASSWKPQVTLEPQAEMPRRTQVRPASRPPVAPRVAQVPGKRLEDYPPQTSSLGPPSSGSMEGAASDGGARNDYLSRVYRHIEPYRSYPAAARAGGQHGRVVTRVTINRDGGLIDLRLDRSSGWPLIDEAEMAAIRRAMPLPPVPNGMRGDPVVLVLPMNY